MTTTKQRCGYVIAGRKVTAGPGSGQELVDPAVQAVGRRRPTILLAAPMTNEVLTYLQTFIAANGFAPSVRELAKHFHWSPDTAHRRLQVLIDEGKIERVGPRAIRVIQEDSPTTRATP